MTSLDLLLFALSVFGKLYKLLLLLLLSLASGHDWKVVAF